MKGSRFRALAARARNCLVVWLFLETAASAEEPPRIGAITVETREVFSGEEASRGWLYGVADALHTTTRESVVRRFLLFAEGDPFDPVLLEESERNLRLLGFIKSASVTAGWAHDGVVDIIVVTQDALTLQIGVSGGSIGGRLLGGLKLGEHNLFGTGRELTVGFGKEMQRSFRSIELRDPSLFAAYGVGHLLYASNSDGADRVLEYQRPFYSVRTPWAVELDLRDISQRDAIYSGGQASSLYRHQWTQLTGRYAVAVRRASRDALRIGVGLDWRDDRFVSLPGGSSEVRPSDRKFHYVFLEGEAVHNDFVKLDYVNRDLRVEDFSLGRRVAVRLGVSPAALGAPRTTEMARLQWDEGFRVGRGSILLVTASGETRLDGGQAGNAVLDARLLFVHRFETAVTQTLVSRLAFTRGWNLDGDTQFFADGTAGLRAYRLYAFEGDRRILWNVEHRIFSGQEMFQLVSPGAAVFVDAAAIAPRGGSFRIKADAGIGLRFAITRAASVPILRVDLGYALQPDPRGRRGWLLSFSGGQAF